MNTTSAKRLRASSTPSSLPASLTTRRCRCSKPTYTTRSLGSPTIGPRSPMSTRGATCRSPPRAWSLSLPTRRRRMLSTGTTAMFWMLNGTSSMITSPPKTSRNPATPSSSGASAIVLLMPSGASRPLRQPGLPRPAPHPRPAPPHPRPRSLSLHPLPPRNARDDSFWISELTLCVRSLLCSPSYCSVFCVSAVWEYRGDTIVLTSNLCRTLCRRSLLCSSLYCTMCSA